MPAKIACTRLRPHSVMTTSIIHACACPTTRPPESLRPISVKPLHVASKSFLKHILKSLRLLFERRPQVEGIALAFASPGDQLKLPFMHVHVFRVGKHEARDYRNGNGCDIYYNAWFWYQGLLFVTHIAFWCRRKIWEIRWSNIFMKLNTCNCKGVT